MRAELVSIRLAEAVAVVRLPERDWESRRGALRVETLYPAAAELDEEAVGWYLLRDEAGRQLKVELRGGRPVRGSQHRFRALAPRVQAETLKGRLVEPDSSEEIPVRVRLWRYRGQAGWHGTLQPLSLTPEELLSRGARWRLELGAEARVVVLRGFRALPGGERAFSFQELPQDAQG